MGVSSGSRVILALVEKQPGFLAVKDVHAKPVTRLANVDPLWQFTRNDLDTVLSPSSPADLGIVADQNRARGQQTSEKRHDRVEPPIGRLAQRLDHETRARLIAESIDDEPGSRSASPLTTRHAVPSMCNASRHAMAARMRASNSSVFIDHRRCHEPEGDLRCVAEERPAERTIAFGHDVNDVARLRVGPDNVRAIDPGMARRHAFSGAARDDGRWWHAASVAGRADR